LVSERVRVILGASIPEKAVGTDLFDDPPVVRTVLCCSEKAGQGSLNLSLTKHALRVTVIGMSFQRMRGPLLWGTDEG
jgi:hypothetical protein